MITDTNSEDRLVQKTFAEHLEKVLGWESVYAYNNETFGPHGTLGRLSFRGWSKGVEAYRSQNILGVHE